MVVDESPTGSRLLYKQVKEQILKWINEGTFKAGEVIPPERELCKNLGVSRYTVRKAIQELAREGYLYRVQGNGTFVFDKNRANQKKSRFIGVILPSCDSEMEMKILSGIQKGLREVNFNLVFVASDSDYKKEAEYIQRLKNEGAAGLIIMPAEDQADSTAISDLKSEGFPFVLVDRRLQDCETDCVMSDNIDGAYMAIEHLVRLGHERIAFVKHESIRTSSVADRITGYHKALFDFGLDYEKVFSFDPRNGVVELTAFLSTECPSAVVALNAYVALDIVRVCRENGISIPTDLSIVSFDDLDFVRYLEVPLTTIAQASGKIGQKAAELLVEKITGRNYSSEDNYYLQVYYPTRLIERGSCLRVS